MRILQALVLALILSPACLYAGDLPTPKIGRLVMPRPYWETAVEAGRHYGVDPYLIAAVMAIESRFDPDATNKRCRTRGLMQIQDGTARAHGLVDSYDPGGNIWTGAEILARLLKKSGGNIRAALKGYNPEDSGQYSREVLRAYAQAKGAK